MTDGRVAVVTGAASGIGATCSRRLAGREWRVAGLDLNPSHTDLSMTVDVADRDAVAAAVDEIQAQLGTVDLLVTAAGYDERIPVGEISRQSWDRILGVLLGGTVNACAAVLPHMRRQGSGSIVAISSELGLAGSEDNVHYATAKGAVIGFVKALALECAADGITVNSVAPGPTDTPLLEDGSPWRDPAYLATLPLRRLVHPDEIAATVEFLAEERHFFCGEVLSPNAGAVI
ncbi:MAG: 2-hydroxycyclohexanecarboxyl-CoA dehydrogenase [Actinomycetota bacterium]|jgi:NAD(P)-dependent dehydrogenase (short-subunit alcohol dehydrogenase family)|nr:2-hydroxycyclohexanecarboxyl-CoA dehydrogenase [Actinomycetota bacterium]